MGASDTERDGYSSRPAKKDLPTSQGDRLAASYNPMKRPTLEDILSDKALSPWTLKAFSGWCGKNMCAENLNFVVDARAYQKNYTTWRVEHPEDTPASSSDERAVTLNGMWKRIIKDYITPNGLQEVNLSANVRDKLASIPESHIPPAPDILQPAVRQIRGLLEDSILMSFLNEMQPPGTELSHTESLPSRAPNPRTAAPQITPSISASASSSASTKNPKRSQVTSPPPNRKGFFHHSSTGSIPHITTDNNALEKEDTTQTMSSVSAPDTDPPAKEPHASSSMTSLAQRERRPSPWSRNDATWKKLSSKLGLKKKPSGGHLRSGDHALDEDEEP